MIVPVMAISNLELTRQIYSEETNGAHAHYREPVPSTELKLSSTIDCVWQMGSIKKRLISLTGYKHTMCANISHL